MRCQGCGYTLEDGATVCSQCDRPTSGYVESASSSRRQADATHRVTVVDVDMPFWSMVAFMLKWTIAAIPALVILGVLFAVLSAILAVLLAGVGASL